MRVRREPPPFRPAEVQELTQLSPRMVRLRLTGPALDGLAVEHPAASVRLLLPSLGASDLVTPTWTGNEFLLPDGERPTIRTFTPRGVGPEGGELALHVVVHGSGRASDWVRAAEPGAPVAVSGPGRGYRIADDASAFLLAGDETAVPAMSELLERLPADADVRVLIEVAQPDARLDLPDHPRSSTEWLDLAAGSPPGDELVAAVERADIRPGTRVWAAGEAAAVQRIRRHLFQERGLSRSQATVRGYWKHGRSADAGDED